jgi:hypothetical protein
MHKLYIMKFKFTQSLFFAVSVFSSQLLMAAAGDYRSAGTGNWGSASSWEIDNGVTWVPASAAPTSADGVITILTGHTITVAAPVTTDQTFVDAGGTLTVNGGTLTLAGAGTQLTVNGTLNLSSANAITGTGNLLVNSIFNWTDGTLSAITTSAAASTVNLSGNITKNLSANFTNNGTFNWATGATAGGISFTNATFTNNGTVNEQFQSNRGFVNTGINSFINNGTFNKTTAFTFFNNNVPFTNAASGIIVGSGTITINPGTMVNNGTIRPGVGVGTIAMSSGTVSGQNTTVTIQLEDLTGAGTGNDLLSLATPAPSTNINLATVTLSISEGTAVPLGSYTIFTTDANGTFINNFANIASLPPNFAVIVNPTSVILNKISPSLPAVWGEFQAIAKNNKVNLSWTTLQEENTSYFSVEYSLDGKEFKSLGTVPAAGSTASARTYQFIHAAPNTSVVNYYRIKLHDLDGKSSSSSTRPVRFSGGAAVAVQASPNPFVNKLQLTVHQEAVHVRISDMNGRMLRSLNLQPGLHNVDMSNLSSGSYTLVIYKQNKVIQSQTIIKQ